jgi:nitrite reductase (NO-forming)
MIPWHVVSGMSGAIIVLPRDGPKSETDKPNGVLLMVPR